MTAAQFASYRAIILGDPTCSGTPPAAQAANAAVWNGVVNGNIIVIGTDPVFHAGGTTGGGVMVDKGVGFAVDQVGMTGAYVDLSCYYNSSAKNTPVPMLAGLGVFTVEGAMCFNDVHIVATHPALVGLTDADLANWSCSVHEVFDSYPADFTVLVIARNFVASSIGMDPTKTYTSYLLDNGANPDTCAPGPMPLNAAQSLVGTCDFGFDGGGSLAVDKTGAGYIGLGKFGVVSIVTGGTVVACGEVDPAHD